MHPFGMGFGMGMASGQLSVDSFPPFSFAGTVSQFRLAWTGNPTSGDISTLVSLGFVSYTGTVTATYASLAWTFTVSAGSTLTIMKPNLLYLMYINGNNASWTYTGMLPSTLTFLILISTNVTWVYDGALPTGLTTLYLQGTKINWSGFGVQPAFTCPSRLLSTSNLVVSIANDVASVVATQNFIDRVNAIALDNTGNATVALTIKKTSTVAQGVDVSALTAKNYTITLGV